MQSIFASARCGIVKRYLQVVLAQEPAEDTMGFLGPTLILSEPICLKTGRDGGTGFNGLLIEARFLRALGEASAGADRYKDLRVTAVLSGHKPFERLESRRDHFLVMAAPTGQDERLREPCIRVRKTLLEPTPGLGATALVDVEQTIGERVADALDGPIAGEPVEISLQTENTECPSARAAERQNRRHSSLKQSSCRST